MGDGRRRRRATRSPSYCLALDAAAATPNALSVCSNGEVGSTCTVSCNTGYKSTTVPNCLVQTASNGIWSPKPACEATLGYCAATSGTANAASECDASVISSVCGFLCALGYSANAPVCKEDVTEPISSEAGQGRWDPLPSCSKLPGYCLSSGAVPNAQNQCASGSIGDACSLLCSDGYESSATPICSALDNVKGQWVPAPLCKAKDNFCLATTAAATPQAVTGCSAGATGATCAFTCNSGFTPPPTRPSVPSSLRPKVNGHPRRPAKPLATSAHRRPRPTP